MTTQDDLELQAALAEIIAEQVAWFGCYRAARAVTAAQRKRELDARVQAINAVGSYLDEFSVRVGALGG